MKPPKTSVPVDLRPKKSPALLILRARLLKGARILGELYRAGKRCKDGFAQRCACKLSNAFCKTKSRFLELVAQERQAGGSRDVPEPGASYYLLEIMRGSEIEATKLTLTFEVAGVEAFKVGPKGIFPWPAMRKMLGDPLLVPLVKDILETFSGAKVLEKEPRQRIDWT